MAVSPPMTPIAWLSLIAVGVSASWLPVYDNHGSPVCTVGGTLQCPAGGRCGCVGTAPTVVPPPCDTTMQSSVPDCYSRCSDSDGACTTYFTCPEGFSKSDMIWTCESGRLANLLGYDYLTNVKLLANRSYGRVITSSTYDNGETWAPSCYSPENYAVGYQTCYTLDPNIGAPTTTTTATTTWGTPMVWENVGEPGKSACRGRTVNDNDQSHYSVRAAQSLEDCKVLCSQDASCKGIEYSRSVLGRCEIWTRPQGIYISKALHGFTCLRYGRPTTSLVKYGDGKDYACRYQDPNDNSASYYEVSSPPALVLSDCKARCAAADICYGIEFSKGRCEIWLRPIKAAKEIPGFECWTYPGATYEPNVLLP